MSSVRFLALAGVLGLAVGLTCTWPLALHMRTAVLDDGTLDGFQFAWNLWWVREALLSLHRHPFLTQYIFYPDGVPLLFHTGSFSLGVLSLPVQLLFGVVSAENVLVITAPALTFVVVALLAREATGDPWAALVGAFLGTITPYAFWVLPVIYLSCGWIPPAMLLVWWWTQQRRAWWLVATLVAVLGFAVFASQEYAMLAIALLGLDVVVRLAAGRRLGLPPLWLAGSAAFFAAAAVMLGGLAALALANPARPAREDQALLGSGFVRGFLMPPWLADWAFPFSRVHYFGTLTLVLMVVAVWRDRPRAAYWLLLAVPIVLMVMGPYLHVDHPFASLPPKGQTVPTSGLPGPYLLLGKFFPLLKFLRAPYRWLAALIPLLAVLAAVGAAALRARAGRPRLVTAVLLALAVLVPAVETLGLRAPLVPAVVPSAYDVVRDDPTEAALLDLPSGFVAGGWALLASRYMFFQTGHGKYLLEGTVSRLPLDRRLVVGRSITDFATMPWLKWVVVHKDLLPTVVSAGKAQAEALIPLVQRQGRLVASDDAIDVYELSTFRPESVWSPRTGDPKLRPRT